MPVDHHPSTRPGSSPLSVGVSHDISSPEAPLRVGVARRKTDKGRTKQRVGKRKTLGLRVKKGLRTGQKRTAKATKVRSTSRCPRFIARVPMQQLVISLRSAARSVPVAASKATFFQRQAWKFIEIVNRGTAAHMRNSRAHAETVQRSMMMRARRLVFSLTSRVVAVACLG